MSDDFPDNNSTSGIVVYGYPGVNGTIETPGDIDWFYYPNRSQPTAVVVTGAQFAITQIILRDQNGNPIATYYGPSANAHINVEPPANSLNTYYVSVTGFTADGQPATGSYTVSAANLVDDYPDTMATAAPLVVNGAPLTGTADYSGDFDWFHITGGAPGEPIQLSVQSAELGTVWISAADQYGNIVVTSTVSAASPTSLVLPPSAAYVRVIGLDASGLNWDTGSYTLTLSSVPDDHGDNVAHATPITIGGPTVSAVDEGGGDWDVFGFHAQAGVPVVFDWLTLPASGATYMIYDQYGRSLYFTNGAMDVDYYHSFMPTISGTYYLFLQAGTGTSFNLIPATDDYSDTLPTNGVLTLDGPDVSGRHDFLDDFDVFAMNFAQPGDYRIEIAPLSLYMINELLAFYDSNGNLLDYRVAVVPGEGLTLHIDTPGTYYLGVESITSLVNHDQIYTLDLHSTTDDYGSSLTTAGTITLDGPVINGSINYNEDIDWLRFDATAGQVIRIDFSTTGFFAWNFQILTDNGSMWTWFDDSLYDANVYYFQVPQSGTYYFALGDPVGNRTFIGTGAYAVGMSVVPGVSSLPIPATVGVPIAGEVLFAEGNQDVFQITVQAGQTIRFDAAAAAYWTLSLSHYGADGTFFWDVLKPPGFDRPIGYTFAESGTYLVTFSGNQAYAGGIENAGAYTFISELVADDAGNSANYAMALTLNGPATTATVNYENDIDWFAITVQAGDVVCFNVTHDASITGLNWDLVGITEGISTTPEGRVLTFEQAGTYYISVQEPYFEEVGGSYSVTATTYHDDYRSDVTTAANITVGGPAFTGQHDFNWDHDWVAVQLEAGENYIFTVSGLATPGNYLNGSINVFDQNGVALGGAGLNVGPTTQLIYTAPYSGTYYLDLFGQYSGASPYTLTAAEFTPPLVQTIDPDVAAVNASNFDHAHVGAANVINIYFGHAGDEFGAIVSDGWFAQEIDAVMNVLATFEAYLNVDFQITDLMANADLAITTFDNPNYVSTFQRADWDVPIPVIGFSYSSPLWTDAALAPGGLGAAVVLNAMGYALGLSFPHAPEGHSYAMEGVTGAFDTGDYDLNQGVYTIMSYNYGWVTSPYGQSASNNFGWQATPMALDIAVLQAIYGANSTANSGASTYTLANANAGGAGWRSIWDTGGADSIVYSGASNAHIDLRPATLAYEVGGAGYLSYVDGIHGGFTIANGVIIENAAGGSGADTLIGNSAANTLNGGAGADNMTGGDGNDTFVVDDAGDVVNESVSGGTDAVQASIDYVLGAEVENLTLVGAALSGAGNGANNIITGNNLANTLSGAGGADTLNGGGGNDELSGGEGNDLLNGGDGRDTASFAMASSGASWHRNADGSWTVNAGGEGSDTVINTEFISFSDRNVHLANAQQTFSGDGTSDLLLRNSSGTLSLWFLNGPSITGAGVGSISAAWSPQTGDFNGDGRDDLLWRNTSTGDMAMWFMNGAAVTGASFGNVGVNWLIDGMGDFNGDGRDDILWRNGATGDMSIWFLNGTSVTGGAFGNVGTGGWIVEDTGDFNGDGRDDILWRNTSTGDMSMWFMNGLAVTGGAFGNVGAGWVVEGTGDFNGDGREDIFWRNSTTGDVSLWYMNGQAVTGFSGFGIGGTWQAEGVGDYNGDGRDDILWRDASGNLVAWYLQAGGGITGQALGGLSTDWVINPGG